jgi:hypothetical protein
MCFAHGSYCWLRRDVRRGRFAQTVATMPRTVSNWRGRFAREGLAGLADRPCPGPAPKYGSETARRILSVLERAPPSGVRALERTAAVRGELPRHVPAQLLIWPTGFQCRQSVGHPMKQVSYYVEGRVEMGPKRT